ncbi:MAG: RsmE family RNA methyltransferase [Bacilli bacterium]|nr:RsmE family RNA methyltransferase [Bacilli bacterium]
MQRYFAKNRDNDCLILDKNDLHHIKNVMRMNNGAEIEIIYDKELYICKICDVNSNKFSIVEKLDDDNEMDIELIVAVGLVKEQKMDIILQKLTELGVSRIIPVKMERSIVKLDNKREKKKIERWNSICKEAAEQSKRNVIPVVDDVITVKELDKIEADYKFVCSVKNKDNLVNKYLQKNSKCAKIVFVIGPEGGLASSEEEYLNDLGYTSISLGRRVLRVETACIYVASVVGFISMG